MFLRKFNLQKVFNNNPNTDNSKKIYLNLYYEPLFNSTIWTILFNSSYNLIF